MKKKFKKIRIPKIKDYPIGAFNTHNSNNTLFDRKYDPCFIQWFIGFFEAEGSFTITQRGEIHLVITQGYRNIFILYYIKDILGFGRVVKQGMQTFRFIVQDYHGLERLINMVNGNLVLEKKKIQLRKFINAFNEYYNKSFVFKDILKRPTINDAWFSGFIDGDGCFSIMYNITKKRFNIFFGWAQKEDIFFLQDFFPNVKAYCVKKKSDQSYHLSIVETFKTNITKKKLYTKLDPVIEYFQKYPLKTTKKNSYALWFYLQNQILKTTCTPQKEANIKFLAKLINLSNDQQPKILLLERED